MRPSTVVCSSLASVCTSAFSSIKALFASVTNCSSSIVPCTAGLHGCQCRCQLHASCAVSLHNWAKRARQVTTPAAAAFHIEALCKGQVLCMGGYAAGRPSHTGLTCVASSSWGMADSLTKRISLSTKTPAHITPWVLILCLSLYHMHRELVLCFHMEGIEISTCSRFPCKPESRTLADLNHVPVCLCRAWFRSLCRLPSAGCVATLCGVRCRLGSWVDEPLRSAICSGCSLNRGSNHHSCRGAVNVA